MPVNKPVGAGVSSACFFPLETADSVKILSEWHIPNIEIFFNSFKELKDGYLERLSALCREAGTKVVSIHPSTSNPPTVPIRGGKTSQSGIIVEGIDNCLVKFAKCCTPVPGDPVVGFITRGFGVSVHRADCPNASDAKRAEEPGRWIKVSWATGELASYQTALDISAKDRDGLTLDVAMTLSAAKVKTTSLSARSMPDGYATLSIVLEVKNQEELTNVINKLEQIQGVYQVKRASG